MENRKILVINEPTQEELEFFDTVLNRPNNIIIQPKGEIKPLISALTTDELIEELIRRNQDVKMLNTVDPTNKSKISLLKGHLKYGKQLQNEFNYTCIVIPECEVE